MEILAHYQQRSVAKNEPKGNETLNAIKSEADKLKREVQDVSNKVDSEKVSLEEMIKELEQSKEEKTRLEKDQNDLAELNKLLRSEVSKKKAKHEEELKEWIKKMQDLDKELAMVAESSIEQPDHVVAAADNNHKPHKQVSQPAVPIAIETPPALIQNIPEQPKKERATAPPAKTVKKAVPAPSNREIGWKDEEMDLEKIIGSGNSESKKSSQTPPVAATATVQNGARRTNPFMNTSQKIPQQTKGVSGNGIFIPKPKP